ncbi:T9SS type A sorting domain-containing protein, partial [Portibacter marinus]|uniref:T9SS type A sorting domain-containing protein n=1 Tax=Portibacter marinus TaxID=2898660 RepID=UPI001F31DF76
VDGPLVGGPCGGTITRTWTYTDACLNIGTATQIITINDTTDPEIACNEQIIELGCNPERPTGEDALAQIISSSDNCGIASTIPTPGEISGVCTKLQSFQIVVSDFCENTSSCQVTFTWTEDNTAPVVTCPTTGLDLGCNPETIPTRLEVIADVTVSDLCDDYTVDAFSPNGIEGEGCEKSQTWTVTATDNCGGLQGSCTVTYSWTEDNTAPVVTCPTTGLDLGCNPETIPTRLEVIADVTVSDLCDDYTVDAFSPNGIEGEGCEKSQTWTVTATDNCGGLQGSCTVTYTWTEDNNAPVVTCPENTYLGCDPEVIPTAEDVIAASSVVDACGASIISAVSPNGIEGEGCEKSQTWTVTAQDNCGGLTNTCQVTYTWRESEETAEIVFVNEDLIGVQPGGTIQVQCFGQDPNWSPPQASVNDVSVNGGCGEELIPVVTEIKIAEGECSSDGYITRYQCTWTVIDECENEISLSIFMEIIDTIPPVLIGVPQDIAVSCESIPIAPTVIAEDECLCADLEFTESLFTDDCLNNQVITRTWTATDCCGNVTIETQRIFISDNAAPSLAVTLPDGNIITDDLSLSFDCNAGGIPGEYLSLTANAASASDLCSGIQNINLSLASSTSSNCSNGSIETTTMTWEAADACGNLSTVTLELNVTDNVGPAILGIQERACATDLPFVYALDDCSSSLLQFVDRLVEGPCGMETRRIYSATDACGNLTRDTMYILNEDVTSPEITLSNPVFAGLDDGSSIVVEWDSQLEDRYTNFGIEDASFNDECEYPLETTFEEVVLSEMECNENKSKGSVNLIWTATDMCGNMSTYTITAVIVDTQAPVIVDFQSEMTVSCSRDIPDVIITDNSGDFSAVINETIANQECPGTYDIIRTIFAEDECGNVLQTSQTVHVVDQQGPRITGVEPYLCEDLSIPNVTAVDACTTDDIEVNMVQDTIVNELCTTEFLVRRIWSASDQCGNTTEIEQIISFNDNTPPDLVYADAAEAYMGQSTELMMSSASDMAVLNQIHNYSVVALDQCAGQIIQPEYTLEVEESVNCAEEGFLSKYHYTWFFTDACGNSVTETAELIIIDDVAPELLNLPLSADFGCNGIPDLGNLELPEFAELTDSMTGTITLTEVMDMVDDKITITNVFTATDVCGNQTLAIQELSALVSSDIACDIDRDKQISCNSHGNVLTAVVTEGTAPYQYEWTIEGKDCQIQTGQGTESIEVYVGFTKVVVGLTVTDANGCITNCETIINCNDKGEIKARSIEELDRIEVTGLNPNPASDRITLEAFSTKTQNAKYHIVTTTDQKLTTQSIELSEGMNAVEINISQLTPGVYFLQVENGTQNEVKRFVKIR